MPKIYNPYAIGAASVCFNIHLSFSLTCLGYRRRFVWFWCIHFTVLGQSTDEIDISSLSAFLGTKQYTDYFNNPSDIEQGGITASMSGGSFLGALAAGFLSDRIGRRHAIQFASVIWVIGSSISSASQNVAMLIVGR